MSTARPEPAASRADQTRSSGVEFRRIAPAYRQVAQQIRELIVDGTLVAGEKLPAEDRLAANLGVSRGTVREALKMLVSEGLAETSRGVAGGTFVTMPRPEVLRGQIETGLDLLSGSAAISRDELYEARVSIEIPSSRWAAERRTEEDLVRLERAATEVQHSTSTVARATTSHDFHQAVVDAAGNRLLSVIAPPIWRAFQRSALGSHGHREAWSGIDEDHVLILRCIEEQDAEGAADAMRRHLLRLRESEL